MASYKLTYLNVRGRGEPIRMILAAANVKFDDVRITRDEWPLLKPSMPWGQIPILELEDGTILAQSMTICRFLAKRFDLAGSTALDSALCDDYVDALSDLLTEMKKIAHPPNEEAKEELKTKFMTEILPQKLQKFETILKESGSLHLVGGKLTWADIVLSNMMDRLDLPTFGGPTLFEDYKYLTMLRAATYSSPGIKQWVETRPKE